MAMRTLLVLIPLALLWLCGCSSSKSLVGNWTGVVQFQGLNVDVQYRFDAKGNLEVWQTANNRTSKQIGPYKWEEGESKFTFVPQRMESDSDQALARMVNEELYKNPKTYTFDLTWADTNTINIRQQSAPPPLDAAITLRRK